MHKQYKTFSDTEIFKSTNQELRQVTYIAMLPDSVDEQGDYVSAVEVRKAHNSFAQSAQNTNLFHMLMSDKFYVIESYLAPTDFEINEVQIQKGTWLMTFQIEDDTIWEMIQDGRINGISVGAKAKAIDLDDDTEKDEE
jgi:hypothetical protein